MVIIEIELIYIHMFNIDKILLELTSLPEFDNQIMLQGVEGVDDPNYGIGFFKDNNHHESDFNVELYPTLTYTNKIIRDLGMTRTRVMKMQSKTCYSYHRDMTQRIHIPLVTNPNCFFVIDDEVVRLPADGNHYFIDTTKRHTFVNASWEERIHIVGCATS